MRHEHSQHNIVCQMCPWSLGFTRHRICVAIYCIPNVDKFGTSVCPSAWSGRAGDRPFTRSTLTERAQQYNGIYPVALVK